MEKCPYCGAQIGDSVFFCEVCGKRVSQGKVYVPDSSVTYWVTVMRVPITNLAIILFFISIIGGVFYASYSSKNANRLNTYRGRAAFSSYKVSGLQRCLVTSNQFLSVGLSAYDWRRSDIDFDEKSKEILSAENVSHEERVKAYKGAEIEKYATKGKAIGNAVGALSLGGVLSCAPGSAIGAWIGEAIFEKLFFYIIA